VRVSAGSYDLNKFLHGGYESDIVSVVYGGPGTGKTNFCLLAAVSQAKKGKKVVYIDTEGGFSVDRVKQIVNGENVNKVLENIMLLKPTSFKEQKQAFDQLLKNLHDGDVGLIIVDSMTILYRLDFADAREKNEDEEGKFSGGMQKISSELAGQMQLLAEIARKRGICVLVTNQVYKWDEDIKMVGGDIMQYWAKCIIELVNDKGRREVRLKKHRSLGEKSFVFQIYDKGVRKRGWL